MFLPVILLNKWIVKNQSKTIAGACRVVHLATRDTIYFASRLNHWTSRIGVHFASNWDHRKTRWPTQNDGKMMGKLKNHRFLWKWWENWARPSHGIGTKWKTHVFPCKRPPRWVTIAGRTSRDSQNPQPRTNREPALHKVCSMYQYPYEHWFMHSLIDWFIDWFIDSFIDWIINWLIDWFIHWLIH